ncbi:MAG: hemerythrin family protein [Pseudomonadota bacterium]
MKLENFILPMKYKTGNEGIDEQHAHLFSILHGMIAVLKNEELLPLKQIDLDIRELIGELQKYTQKHFKYEENIMEKIEYPELAGHRELHSGFIKKIIEIQKTSLKAKEGKYALLNKMIVFIKEWFLQHVFVEDKKWSLMDNETIKNKI